jgi:hypothetical protein
MAATPGNIGALYIEVETTAGTYAVPTQNSDKALRLLEEPTYTPAGGLVEQDRPTVAGGGTPPVLDRLRWDLGLVLPATGIHSDRTADWVDLLKSCAVDVANTSPSGGVGLSITPASDESVPSDNTGTPKVVSPTFVQGGGGTPWVVRQRGTVSRLAALRSDAGVVRMEFEAHGLEHPSGSVIARGDTAFTMAAAEFRSAANHPEFKPRMSLTIGGEDYGPCISDWAFDPGFDLVERPCDGTGYGFAISSCFPRRPATLVVTSEQVDPALWASMWTEEDGGEVVLLATRTIGTVTWNLRITLPAHRVVAIETSGDAIRTSTVTLQAITDTADGQWEIEFERTVAA